MAGAVISTLLVTSLTGVIPFAFASLSFSSTFNISNDSGAATNPQVAASASYVYVVWQDSSSGRSKTLFRAGSHNGTSIGTTLNLSNDTAYSLNPQLAASGSNVYAVWEDNATGNYKTYFRASSNYGTSFSSTINLGTTVRVDETNPQLASYGTNVYVVWVEGAKTPVISFRASNNYGASFGSIITLTGSSGTSFLSPETPLTRDIIAQGSYVYVVWRQNVASGNDDVFFDASSNNGTSFGSVLNLSNNLGESFNPAMAAIGSNVYVVWPDTNPGHFQIFFRSSTNNGVNWTPSLSQSAMNLSSTSGIAIEAQVAASGNYVDVSWRDSTLGNSQIFFKSSNNNGGLFGPLINLSSDSGTASNARMAAGGGNVYVTWDDTTPGHDQTFFVTSGNGGGSFGSPSNLSSDSGFATNPALAGTVSNTYVAWDDDTPGHNQIFFKIGSTATISQPTADGQSVLTNVNQSVMILLTGGDPQGLGLTFYLVSNSTHGVLGTITSAGPTSAQGRYTPNPNFTGMDSFTFKVSNSWLNSTAATVSLTVVSTVASGLGGGRGNFQV